MESAYLIARSFPVCIRRVKAGRQTLSPLLSQQKGEKRIRERKKEKTKESAQLTGWRASARSLSWRAGRLA